VRQRLAAAVTAVVRAAESVPGGRPGLAALLAAGAVAIAVLARLYHPRRPRADPLRAGPGPARPAGPALAAFLRYDERLGPLRRRPHESLAELARRLADAAPVGALAVVESECYGASPPPEAERAAAVLDGWQPAAT
jgi:hypothetical protein